MKRNKMSPRTEVALSVLPDLNSLTTRLGPEGRVSFFRKHTQRGGPELDHEQLFGFTSLVLSTEEEVPAKPSPRVN